MPLPCPAKLNVRTPMAHINDQANRPVASAWPPISQKMAYQKTQLSAKCSDVVSGCAMDPHLRYCA